jgi:phosphatidylglycerophosphate synthase
MTSQAPPRRTRTASSGRHGAVLDLGVGVILLLVVAGAIAFAFALPPTYLLRVAALYGLTSTLLLRHLPPQRPGPGLGPANQVTLGRATLVLALAALVPHPQVQFDGGHWFVIGLATVALCLDGVDGWVARRTKSASAFGARFDMELDSFFMLVLAALVWRSGRVGPWVLLLGLPRYVFVATGWMLPWLRAPLPERFRRKAGCVVQGIVLLVCLGPSVPAPLAIASAGAALVLLLASFALDIVWLFRQRHQRPSVG